VLENVRVKNRYVQRVRDTKAFII